MSKFINNSNDTDTNDIVHSEYSDHIYVKESDSKEVLFDRNNPIVKIMLIVIGGIAFLGTLYYIMVAIGVLK